MANTEIWKRFRFYRSYHFTALESLWLAVDDAKLTQLTRASLNEAVHYQNLVALAPKYDR